MLLRILNSQNQCMLWRSVGFLSCVVGLVCYALCSSFKRLFGEWNLAKIILYTIISLVISSIVLLAVKGQVSKGFKLRAHMGFLVLMLTSLYSFFYDKDVNGKPDVLSIIPSAAFALTSLCLSRLLDFGFEVDLFSFFLGCLTVQLMKISLILAFVAAGFCYPLIVFRSYLDSQLEIGDTSTEDHVNIQIDTANGVMVNVETRQSPSGGPFIGESNSGDNPQDIEDDKDMSSFLVGTPCVQTNSFSAETNNSEIQSNPQSELEIEAISIEDNAAIGNGVKASTEKHGVHEETQRFPSVGALPGESNFGDSQQNIEDIGNSLDMGNNEIQLEIHAN